MGRVTSFFYPLHHLTPPPPPPAPRNLGSPLFQQRFPAADAGPDLAAGRRREFSVRPSLPASLPSPSSPPPPPLPALPPSFSSEAVESPRSGERRAPSSQSWFRTEPRKCASWKPGPGAASPGLSPERSGPAPRPDSGPSRGAEPESRAGGPAQRPGEAGSRTAGGRETAAGRGQRAECTERPCSEQGAARDGGPLWGADPGWPRARSGSRADGGGRASPSPAAPACCVAGHVSGNPGLPAARTCTEEQERGAASAEPGTGLSSKCAPSAPRALRAAAPLSPALRSLTLAPPRCWAHAVSYLCEFPPFAKFFEKERTPTYPQQRVPVAAPRGRTQVLGSGVAAW